jgi:hypothetical protein
MIADVNWRRRTLDLTLDEADAMALLVRATRLDLSHGGRFEVRSERRIYLWSCGRGAQRAPVGCVHLRWGAPGSDRVAVEELSWDPVGGCEPDLHLALELLTRPCR